MSKRFVYKRPISKVDDCNGMHTPHRMREFKSVKGVGEKIANQFKDLGLNSMSGKKLPKSVFKK